MTHFNIGLLACTAFIFSAILALKPAHADYGNKAIWVICDERQNYVEIGLFILWNTELDSYLLKYPLGVATEGTRQTTVFLDRDRSYSRTCTLGSRKIEMTIDRNDTLTIKENEQTTTVKEIDYVWLAVGEEYQLRSDESKKWQECTGAIDGAAGHPLECRGLTKSRTTNTEEIEAFWNK